MKQHNICMDCRKSKAGRFTRLRTGGGSLPSWHCWTCLPAGQGRDEDETTEAPKTPATAVTQMPTVVKVREEGLALIPPLQGAVEALTITTPEEYLVADGILGRIQAARKTWGARMERIIRPIRQGLDEIYALNRDVDKPLETMERQVKAEMMAFKAEERRLIQVAAVKKQAEEERLRKEAEDLAAKESTARTRQLRERLAIAREQAEAKLTTVMMEESPAPVLGENSSARFPWKARVVDLGDFVQGVASGIVPHDCLTIVHSAVQRYYKDNPERVKAWPGVEVYQDTQIVGR